ncbi:hypothetical protein PXO_00675 [Xanthomonas oryzae pv. oryzae PXO99A]|uniref:Uncharacterized protein n=1 Tax=Xanthomonas oryzae pv. oryzae (strain PXO99A) TaxID=360094 RepID=A0A0K0GKP6_XANOP|nr:hypothetical protein PXO_00675 [Xanthomonas oryzae pv. oryzae PXO99A]
MRGCQWCSQSDAETQAHRQNQRTRAMLAACKGFHIKLRHGVSL